MGAGKRGVKKAAVQSAWQKINARIRSLSLLPFFPLIYSALLRNNMSNSLLLKTCLNETATALRFHILMLFDPASSAETSGQMC